MPTIALVILLVGSSPEAAFWDWFVANAPRVGTIKTAREPVADELAAELLKVDQDLTFELSVSKTPHEFIISAAGMRRAFPAVKRLVAAAPRVPGWTILAFRQRHSERYATRVGQYEAKPSEVWMHATRREQVIDVVLFMPRFGDDSSVEQVAYLLLDGLLGEYDVETRIGGIDVKPLPPDPKASALRPLTDLPSLVDAMAVQ